MSSSQFSPWLIAIVVSVILAPISNMLFRKYVEPILPNAKLAAKILAGVFWWVTAIYEVSCPIYFLVKAMQPSTPFDKNFVVIVSASWTAFAINVTLIMIYLVVRVMRKHVSKTHELFNAITDHRQTLQELVDYVNHVGSTDTEILKLIVRVLEEDHTRQQELEERIKYLEGH